MATIFTQNIKNFKLRLNIESYFSFASLTKADYDHGDIFWKVFWWTNLKFK